MVLLFLQVKVTALADNDPSSQFHYLLQVSPGCLRRATTTAKLNEMNVLPSLLCVSLSPEMRSNPVTPQRPGALMRAAASSTLDICRACSTCPVLQRFHLRTALSSPFSLGINPKNPVRAYCIYLSLSCFRWLSSFKDPRGGVSLITFVTPRRQSLSEGAWMSCSLALSPL